jgi:penicillin G amidase
MLHKLCVYVAALFVASTAVGAGFLAFLQYISTPRVDGVIPVTGLKAPVTISFDRFSVPIIRAVSRRDAYTALGFVTASDRLFQMDLMRRNAAGRLAEVIGGAAVRTDSRQRNLGLNQTAKRIVADLPDAHKEVLQAYVDGINDAIGQINMLPPEFLVLGYRPEPWRMEDSVLVALGMFQILSISESDERMLSVMTETLPAEVVAFLTPDTDRYTQTFDGDSRSRRPIMAIPVEALAALQEQPIDGEISGIVDAGAAVVGSNNWAVNGTRTADGRAILANDMHLPLAVPNVWYRAALRYAGVELAGITLPGVPLLIAGSNSHVAWGFTSALADDLDLVTLQLDPSRPDQYRTPEGWKRFTMLSETIDVKGGLSVSLQRRMTIWGPVAQRTLMHRTVAIHWTALQPGGVDFGLLEMERAASVEQALTIMNHSGLPVMNVGLADDSGHIAWTLTGKIPRRRGLDGATSRVWGDSPIGWFGMIPPDQLPRLIDPPSGYLATANNRTVGMAYPYPLGHNYASGFRASRINQRLSTMDRITEQDLFTLQLDTETDFYGFYRSLALSVLNEQAIRSNPELAAVREYLAAWDGRADVVSQGLGLLTFYRQALADAIFPTFLNACRQADPNFRYRWFKMDSPLQQILTERPPQILPRPDRYRDWNALLLSVLERSVDTLKQRSSVDRLDSLRWGAINRTEIRHPFSDAIPILGGLLDMPEDELAGCSHCIRVARRRHGVSERLVVAPGHAEDAILHMPGGQSGNPLSEHYADQQHYWVNGLPLPLVSDEVRHRMTLIPNE